MNPYSWDKEDSTKKIIGYYNIIGNNTALQNLKIQPK